MDVSKADADITGTLPNLTITASSGVRRVYGKNVSGTISGTAELYLVNCTGSVTVSGNNAKIYTNNCPALTISGITLSNWRNVYVDGKAECLISNSVYTSRPTDRGETTVSFTSQLGDVLILSVQQGTDLGGSTCAWDVMEKRTNQTFYIGFISSIYGYSSNHTVFMSNIGLTLYTAESTWNSNLGANAFVQIVQIRAERYL